MSPKYPHSNQSSQASNLVSNKTNCDETSHILIAGESENELNNYLHPQKFVTIIYESALSYIRTAYNFAGH